MSQTSGMAGEALGARGRRATNGRAMVLLTAAVVVLVLLLHALDKPSVTPFSSTDAAKASSAINQAAPPVSATPAPTTSQARVPSEVKVLVLNGTGMSGAGAKVATRLKPIGYQLPAPSNTTSKATSSSVDFAPGYQAEAQALATSLGLPSTAVQAIPTPAPVADTAGSNLLVVVGNELASAAPTSTGSGGGAAASNSTNGSNQSAVATGQQGSSGSSSGPLTQPSGNAGGATSSNSTTK